MTKTLEQTIIGSQTEECRYCGSMTFGWTGDSYGEFPNLTYGPVARTGSSHRCMTCGYGYTTDECPGGGETRSTDHYPIYGDYSNNYGCVCDYNEDGSPDGSCWECRTFKDCNSVKEIELVLLKIRQKEQLEQEVKKAQEAMQQPRDMGFEDNDIPF